MVFFNYALRKLNAKIVYYGPGLCGKTTNLQWVHDNFQGGDKGKMVSLATEGDRTIFFDLLPLDIGTIRGMDVTLQLYTVPGQVHYNSTRQLVLRGADGVVFVADSQRAMQSSNIDSLKNLDENLGLQGFNLGKFPHVIQFNKRDLGDLMTVEEMDSGLNRFDAPFFEGVAVEGIGVQETLEGIVRLVMRSLKDRYEARGLGVDPSSIKPASAPGPRPIVEEPSSPAPTGPMPLGAAEPPMPPAVPFGGGLDSEQAAGPSAIDVEPIPFEEIDTQTEVLVPPQVEPDVEEYLPDPADLLPTGPGMPVESDNENVRVAQYDTAEVEELQESLPDDDGAPPEETVFDSEDTGLAEVSDDAEVDALPEPTGVEEEFSADQVDELGYDLRTGDAVDDILASVIGVQKIEDPAPSPDVVEGAQPALDTDFSEVETSFEAEPDDEAEEVVPAPIPEGDGIGMPSRPSTLAAVIFDENDPFLEGPWEEPRAELPVSSAVVLADDVDRLPVSVSAEDNSLALKLTGTGAIVESGQVRELDIEVPVPGTWVGNRKVTLQLRLTLLPITEDENDGTTGPA